MSRHVVGTYEGIKLCDVSGAGEADSFVDRTKLALDLLGSCDGRRLRRVKHWIRYVVHTEALARGGYDSSLGACYVDLSFFRFDQDPGWCVLQYASLLVHEATHAVIEARGIRYNRATRGRVERLCREEEGRFLTKASPWPADVVLGDCDEKWLAEYWGFCWSWRLALRRAREILREEPDMRKSRP